MSVSYHQYKLWRDSPRAFAFQCMGYRKPETPGPALQGTLTHLAIQAAYDNESPIVAVNRKCREVQAGLERLSDDPIASSYIEALVQQRQQALAWAEEYWSWYQQVCDKTFKPEILEGEFETDAGVMIHPDFIGTDHDPKDERGIEQRWIIDFKTTKNPRPEQLNDSLQVDLYAYTMGQLGTQVDMVAYHIISGEHAKMAVIEVERPPYMEAAERLYNQLAWLNDWKKLDTFIETCLETESAQLGTTWTDYWKPEKIYRLHGLNAATDWMDEQGYMVKKKKE